MTNALFYITKVLEKHEKLALLVFMFLILLSLSMKKTRRNCGVQAINVVPKGSHKLEQNAHVLKK